MGRRYCINASRHKGYWRVLKGYCRTQNEVLVETMRKYDKALELLKAIASDGGDKTALQVCSTPRRATGASIRMYMCVCSWVCVRVCVCAYISEPISISIYV